MKKWLFISGWAHGRAPMQGLAKALDCPPSSVCSLADLDSGTGSCPDYAAGLSSRLGDNADRGLLIGWSTGGCVALEAALRWPEKIVGLVLISATPCSCSAPGFPWGIAESELRAMKLGIRRNFAKTVRGFLEKSAWPRQLTSDQVQPILSEAGGEGVIKLGRGLTYLKQADFRAGLQTVASPSLILHGKKDLIVPLKAAEWMNSRIKHASYRIWPEEGHDLVKQQVAELIKEIKFFSGKSE